jgi:hypothetical protein
LIRRAARGVLLDLPNAIRKAAEFDLKAARASSLTTAMLSEMRWIVAFNALLILLAVAIARGLVPLKAFSGLVASFHATIGITPPTQKQLRWVIVAWIASALLIFDGMLLLFLYVF